MKNERILNALGKADDKYVEEAMPVKAKTESAFDGDTAQAVPAAAGTKKRSIGGWVAAAACLCAAVGGLTLWSAFGSGNTLIEGGSTQGNSHSQDIDLSGEDTDPEKEDYYANTTVTHPVIYLSREELYTNFWTMYIPRRLPENYMLVEDTLFEAADYPGDGTIYMQITDGSNPISYTVYADTFRYDSLGSDSALLTRDIGIDDMPLLKANGWIDCGNSVVKINIDIAEPDLISDEELYRFVMSAPCFDNLAASGLETMSLSSRIYTGLPVVEFEPYYDVERYTLSGEVFESSSVIVGFDGTYAYFNKWSQEDENGNALPEGELITQIGWYNVKTGETGLLPDKGNRGMISYIYSDGEYVYCTKEVLDNEADSIDTLSRGVVRYNIKTGKEEIIIDMGNDGCPYDVTVNGTSMFMHVYFLEESETRLLCYDMTSGVFDTKAKSVNDLPASAFSYIDVDEYSYIVTLPYMDGVVYVTALEDNSPNFVADTCALFYWDGKNDSVPLFEARTEDIIDGEKGEQLCFSDGEIIYFVNETYANGWDDASGMQDTLFSYDLSSASEAFGFPSEHMIANNKNPSDSPYHEWHAANASCGGGMVAIDPYSGLIYDAENGWFTYVNKNVYYRTIGNDSSFDGMVMLEYADVEYDANVDFVDYPEGGNDLTLCVITRR